MPRAAPLTPGPLSSPPDCTALRPKQSLTVYLLQVNVGGAGPRAAGPGDGMPCIARGPAGGWRGSSPVFITPLLLQMRGPGRPSASRGQQRKPGACVVTDGPLSVHQGGDGGLPRGPAVHLQRAGTGGHGAGPSLREALALRRRERQTRPAGQGRACVRRTHRARASDSARRRRPCRPRAWASGTTGL